MSGPRVPLFDLRLAPEDLAAVEGVLRSGWLSMGPRTQAFEEAFADHLGVRHALATSSCTAALHLAYLAAGVGPGDEVIVPAITFVATAAAARYCGAEPVLADVLGPHDLGVDPADVEARITPRTRAVCVVHFGGYTAAVEPLRELCAARGLALVEDAAHAPQTAPAGLAGTFSFFANKVLSCGEGGLLATQDDEVAALVRSRRSHAMTSGTWDRHRGHAAGYDVTALGFNYRMDEVRAALLASRLPRLQEDIAARRRLVRRYRTLLAGIDGLTVPYRDDEVECSACYVMPVLVDEPAWRDPLREALSARGVQTSVLYPAVHEFTAYAGSAPGGLPRSERIARTELTLPLYPHLAAGDLELVVQALDDGLRALRP
ncbi:MAG: DegT/DnrJ/EryC1/StrS family aminotransferase [Solirubrobacteraceae bacterium MAG38_C4-C5]|nr:DegT/DnrJ/EryC1/StrS family aminotransferase [Candidatus Siliceabacter maunaloa]